MSSHCFLPKLIVLMSLEAVELDDNHRYKNNVGQEKYIKVKREKIKMTLKM